MVIVVAYGQIIPKEFLSLTKKGFINIHASLLPKWRGAAPRPMILKDIAEETGVSINTALGRMRYAVLNISKLRDNNQNAQDVSEKLSSLAAKKILDNIDEILEDRAKFINQDHSKKTYASKIQKEEGKIDWNDNAQLINQKINGLYPVPGAFFIFKGERYKVLKAKIGDRPGRPGEVVSDYLEVVCGSKQSIKITEIQRQGKRPQNIGEFMLGSQIKKGSMILND